MNDQFAIIPAAAADTYFNSVEGLFVCSTFEHFPPQHSPEYVMYKHLVSDNKAKIEFYDFHAVIVREGERGARCGSLWKTMNVACHVLGGFERVANGFGSEVCVDVMNR